MADLDLATLDALASAATLGPWRTRPGDGALDHQARFPTASEVLVFAPGDCEDHPVADFSCNHTCRMDVDTEANARFVAALVSAWPAIRERIAQ